MKRPVAFSSAPDREGPTIVAGMSVRESVRQQGSQDPVRVPALARTAAILQGIRDAGRPMSLAELTEVTGFPKSSAMGICHALTEEHMLARGVDGTYALGSRVFELGSAARNHNWRLRDIGFTYPIDESFFVAEINALRGVAVALGRRSTGAMCRGGQGAPVPTDSRLRRGPRRPHPGRAGGVRRAGSRVRLCARGKDPGGSHRFSAHRSRRGGRDR